MATEIERKFLLANENWRQEVSESQRLIQGYIARGDNAAIRVRITGQKAELNIKSSADGIHRMEFEYEIPLADAEEIIESVSLKPVIDKTRHKIIAGPHTWEIDEFHAENKGLIMAEIELGSAEESFEHPAWLGEEVSTDKRYFNSYLSKHPYTTW